MHITTITLIISILSLVMSFFMVGFLPSLVSFIMGLVLFFKEEEKSIETVRIIAIGTAGLALPIVMYLNTFGFGLPVKGDMYASSFQQILSTNYSNFGIHVFDPKTTVSQETELAATEPDNLPEQEDDQTYFVQNDIKVDKEEEEQKDNDTNVVENNGIFESLDSIDPKEKNKGGIVSIAPSDDDMPSYGGLPVGTILVAQYFREDDHNCNPVLVLQNKTGDLCRFECRFIARDKEGEELAVSDKTVEVVRDGSVFVFEGRFDKRDLGGKIPDAYEFLITKRTPYETDMAKYISVHTAVEGSSALLTAENKSDKKVKVDAYVLFFDGKELVDCMWMIPQNIDEVCLDPGSAATIQGDAYYRFDRVETFYTAYEAVGENG
ncbi:hypothetical protein [Butyrivibrio sp. AE2032]|uniref:hypothetical protein n=1 Tax=Butyrivibrio sp. AE2032 TaxID=1458463 RepID=UPI0016398561|nr:hypothetical protein [Butyrivibrio sp. AE2032]